MCDIIHGWDDRQHLSPKSVLFFEPYETSEGSSSDRTRSSHLSRSIADLRHFSGNIRTFELIEPWSSSRLCLTPRRIIHASRMDYVHYQSLFRDTLLLLEPWQETRERILVVVSRRKHPRNHEHLRDHPDTALFVLIHRLRKKKHILHKPEKNIPRGVLFEKQRRKTSTTL